ncbi:hypothetical protein LIA77_10279 [Sarocladium implicatum]|nr:hypothetical protein LIA77_10279 [Sarocladium implicatum]
MTTFEKALSIPSQQTNTWNTLGLWSLMPGRSHTKLTRYTRVASQDSRSSPCHSDVLTQVARQLIRAGSSLDTVDQIRCTSFSVKVSSPASLAARALDDNASNGPSNEQGSTTFLVSNQCNH